MSDEELIEELAAHARNFQESNGEVNPFLGHEYELLTQAAQRIGQLRGNLTIRNLT
jgi:hypothetical protein